MEPLVLPQRTLREDDPLWEGKVKPEPWFWREKKDKMISPESTILQKGVYLIDGRAKPDYKEPNYKDELQKYEDDGFMDDMIEGLRKRGTIKRVSHVPDDSRFGVSPIEIEGVILPQLARAIGKDALGSEGRVVNTPYKIFNVAGNMGHSEWGKTTTWEWFGDKFGSDRRLGGGNSGGGGLASVRCDLSGHRGDFIGFRPMIAFPSPKA